MKKAIVITDLTRMYEGRVCIAGYDKDGRCIRPVLPPPGISENSLFKQGRPIIFPFAWVEFDLLNPIPQPPHTEDHHFIAGSPQLLKIETNRQSILDRSIFENVSAIFEQPIHSDFGFYIMDCQGPRSLGTIRPTNIIKVLYEQGLEGVWDYRIVFMDSEGTIYRLKITDLTWHYYCDSLRGEDSDPAKIASGLTAILKSSMVYLRVGLARGWKKFPDRCYLQITGIFTFPDFLKGKTFADFAPKNKGITRSS